MTDAIRDAADLIVDPIWFYDRAANLNTRNLLSRPGAFIGVDGNPSAAVAPLQRDLQSLTIADSRIDMVRGYAQMGSGIQDDTVQGLNSDGRQTAREFVGRREASGNRLALEARIYEEMSLEKRANFMVAMDKQFLEMPTMVTILGDGATIDPVTMQPLSSTRDTMGEPDMLQNYAARALGASMALSKGNAQQNMQVLLQGLGTPIGQSVMGNINAVNFWRNVFRTFEVPNLNEIFQQNPALAQQVDAATQGQGGLSAVPSTGQVLQNGLPSGNSALPIPGSPGVPAGAAEQAPPLPALPQ